MAPNAPPASDHRASHQRRQLLHPCPAANFAPTVSRGARLSADGVILTSAEREVVEEVKAAVATTLVVSVGLSVGLSVATGVASSAAAATAAAAGGAAVGGAAAGGTAGASGAGGWSEQGGGAMLPLIFWLQRFANSEGLGIPVSNVQRAVAGRSAGPPRAAHRVGREGEEGASPGGGAPGWERGREGTRQATSPTTSQAATTPAQLAKLLNLLTTWLMSVGMSLSLLSMGARLPVAARS